MLRTSARLALGLLVLARLQADTAVARAPVRLKTAAETTVERIIDSVYRQHFRVYRIGSRIMTLRIPFGMNGERQGTPGFVQEFAFGGKGTAEELWPLIDAAIGSDGFRAYAARLLEPREQVVIFDLERRSYAVSYDPRLIGLMERGPYPGTETRIHVLRFGGRVTEADVYNYLYAVAGLGVDCAGFVYNVLKSVLLGFGVEADREYGRIWGVAPARAAQFAGLWFLDPRNRFVEAASERIEDLRPGDIILFRGGDGAFKHSALVQSIDLEQGVLRYVQATDWAEESERGVHDSLIRFSDPKAGLRDPSLKWLQQVRPPFRGEVEPRYWRNDGHRYFWYPADQGSMVVRLRLAKWALQRVEPGYYENTYPAPPPRAAAPEGPGSAATSSSP